MRHSEFVLDVFLDPGEFYFGDRDTRIRTLLGSCVAISVWHPRYLVGGMCHYLLPEYRPTKANNHLDGRYANEALELFQREIRKIDTHPSEYVVKMFGGGNQFGKGNTQSELNIPEKNILIGKKLLHEHGFALTSSHLGGHGHRNIVFDVWNGDVWVQHVKKAG